MTVAKAETEDPSISDDSNFQPTRMPDRSSGPDVSRAFIVHALTLLSHGYLPRIERCFQDLTDEQIWWRPNDECNSIGNLVLHLSGNVRQWIVSGVGGELDERHRDAEFQQREIINKTDLINQLRLTVVEATRVLRALDPKTLMEFRMIQQKQVSILEAVLHVTEHFSMHTGQIIQLTKILTSKDLKFYDFSGGAPVGTWK